MKLFVETWTEFKTLLANKVAMVQYVMRQNYYHIFFVDGNTYWYHEIKKEDPVVGGSDQEDFENNYLPVANNPIEPRNSEGKVLTIAVSRPQRWQTSFSTCGDDLVTPEIGGGTPMFWDFSNTDNDVAAPTGYKRKRIELMYLDPIYIKEGTIYFHNAKKGSYFDMYIVAKAGSYYLDNNKVPQYAATDTPFAKYICKHFFAGDCAMGDELNTESATEDAFPTFYAIWVEVTVPDTDTDSYGYGELELYRERTMII